MAKKITVGCPAMVKLYNVNMGGVDKMDALVGFYRTIFRSKKWYHRIFFHFCDVALINAWLLYRRDFDASESTGKSLTLYDFKGNISYCLRNQNKPLVRGPGRPSAAGNVAPVVPGKSKRSRVPPKAVVEDTVDHLPVGLPKRGRCRMEGCTSQPVFYCLKCKVFLCVGNNKNCFPRFHGVDPDINDILDRLQ